MLKHWYLQRFWTMIVAKNCYFWSVFPQISCGGYPQNSSKFPKPHFLLTCTYFGGRRHGRNLPMAKATDGLAFGITRHCRIEGLPPMPPTPSIPTLQKGCARQTSMYLIAFVVFAFICHISNWCRALSINSISTMLWSASTSIEGRRCSDPLWLWCVKGCQG